MHTYIYRGRRDGYGQLSRVSYGDLAIVSPTVHFRKIQTKTLTV